MKGFLTRNQIEYVFFHFTQTYKIAPVLWRHIIFIKSTEPLPDGCRKIMFRLSPYPLQFNQIKLSEGIPILFPLNDSHITYHEEGENLVFNDDLLKSAFYLLSGYQEYQSPEKDQYGRYPYDGSIQKKLGVINKPIVNYYFQIIAQGISHFCEKNNIIFDVRQTFYHFGFLLTHDVDLISKYHFSQIKLRIAQILRLKKPDETDLQNIYTILKSIFNILKFPGIHDPWWNFNTVRKLEALFGFKSIFFFLGKGYKIDSRYSVLTPKIKNLINYLSREGCEIGLHNTVKSVEDDKIMEQHLHDLCLAAGHKIYGARQHWLMFNFPDTMRKEFVFGLEYDSSLGFPQHEGFRNSYCLPFKLYDFSIDRMIDLWEFPLNVMDSTLFDYRGYDYSGAFNSICEIVREIIKFRGVFTLLWHNHYLDESRKPGITIFYQDLLAMIKQAGAQNFLGKELVELYNKMDLNFNMTNR